MAKPKIHSRFDRPAAKKHRPTGPSMAQQQFKAEANINNIHDRYVRTSMMPTDPRMPLYGDYSSADFLTMQNKIVDAEQAFESLPAKLRKRFRNDPYQFFRFMEDPENVEEAKGLGLLVPRPEEPQQVDLADEIAKAILKNGEKTP